VVFYFGNDLMDAHRFAALDAWSHYRDPALEYPPPPSAASEVKRAPNWVIAGLEAVIDQSALLSRLDSSVRRRLQQSRHFAAIRWSEADEPSYAEGRIGTYFTPRYRTPAVDARRPQVRDGLRITERCFEELAARCTAADVALVVLLLPTKEAVYVQFLADRGEAASSALALHGRAEAEVTHRVQASLDRLELTVVDCTHGLLAALKDDRAVWPATSDGHLNAAGANLVAKLLRQAIAVPGK